MKKIYKNPDIQVVTLSSNTQLMAGSLNMGKGTGTITDEYAPKDGFGEAREYDFDED